MSRAQAGLAARQPLAGLHRQRAAARSRRSAPRSPPGPVSMPGWQKPKNAAGSGVCAAAGRACRQNRAAAAIPAPSPRCLKALRSRSAPARQAGRCAPYERGEGSLAHLHRRWHRCLNWRLDPAHRLVVSHHPSPNDCPSQYHRPYHQCNEAEIGPNSRFHRYRSCSHAPGPLTGVATALAMALAQL